MPPHKAFELIAKFIEIRGIHKITLDLKNVASSSWVHRGVASYTFLVLATGGATDSPQAAVTRGRKHDRNQGMTVLIKAIAGGHSNNTADSVSGARQVPEDGWTAAFGLQRTRASGW